MSGRNPLQFTVKLCDGDGVDTVDFEGSVQIKIGDGPFQLGGDELSQLLPTSGARTLDEDGARWSLACWRPWPP